LLGEDEVERELMLVLLTASGHKRTEEILADE
jgi:hypothetical protein